MSTETMNHNIHILGGHTVELAKLLINNKGYLYLCENENLRGTESPKSDTKPLKSAIVARIEGVLNPEIGSRDNIDTQSPSYDTALQVARIVISQRLERAKDVYDNEIPTLVLADNLALSTICYGILRLGRMSKDDDDASKISEPYEMRSQKLLNITYYEARENLYCVMATRDKPKKECSPEELHIYQLMENTIYHFTG